MSDNRRKLRIQWTVPLNPDYFRAFLGDLERRAIEAGFSVVIKIDRARDTALAISDTEAELQRFMDWACWLKPNGETWGPDAEKGP